MTVCSGCFGAALQQDPTSCRVGGTSLEQEGVARVAHPHRFGRGGQRQLVVGAAVAENLPAVATVVLWRDAEKCGDPLEKCCRVGFMGLRITCADLSSRDGELLLTQLAVAGVLVLQPNLTPLKQGIFLLSGFFYTFYTTHKTTNMRCYAHIICA